MLRAQIFKNSDKKVKTTGFGGDAICYHVGGIPRQLRARNNEQQKFEIVKREKTEI